MASSSWTRPSGRWSLSWAQVYRRARRTAAGLARLGVAPGERVALLLPTSPGFMDAFFGTLLAGAVPVPLYPPVRLGRLEEYHRATARMLQVTGAAVVLTDARVRLLLGPSVERARPRLGCHTVDEVSRGDEDAGGARASGGAGAHPVLVGLDGGPEAGGADARRRWWRRWRRWRRPCRCRRDAAGGRELAAAVPRHGAHRLPAVGAVLPGQRWC